MEVFPSFHWRRSIYRTEHCIFWCLRVIWTHWTTLGLSDMELEGLRLRKGQWSSKAWSYVSQKRMRRLPTRRHLSLYVLKASRIDTPTVELFEV